jgi:glucokinase
MEIKSLAVEIAKEIDKYNLKPMRLISRHRFVIELDLLHVFAECGGSDRTFAIAYAILKHVDGSNIVVVTHKEIYERLHMTKKTYFDKLKCLQIHDFIRVIANPCGKRGTVKYMVNPHLVFNQKKMNSTLKLNEAIQLWHTLVPKKS